jgi:hypothetical protein
MANADNIHKHPTAPAVSFVGNPAEFFELSLTAMQSVPRGDLQELHRQGIALRFRQHVEQIPMVARLAEKQQISVIDDIDDVVPLLFEHTIYKSYPPTLLARQRFDALTGWLDKLTSVDLTGLDVSDCDSIDSWMETLATARHVDLAHSSGTAGTMSFLPWSHRDRHLQGICRRVGETQRFGEPPTDVQLNAPYHYIRFVNRGREDHMVDVLTQGLSGHHHVVDPTPHSADLLWLASQLKLAAVRGDASRVEVPDNLLARRPELRQTMDGADERRARGIARVRQLTGARIFWHTLPFDIYTLAAEHLARGEHWSFDECSVLNIAGGAKGNALPENWEAVVREFVGLPPKFGYGMTELTSVARRCEAGRYHLQPWIVPFVLDVDTSELLPRSGVQLGRAAFFDLVPESHWGGVISGDEIELDYDSPCDCGATSVHISSRIERISEKRGGDDKITCAASPKAHAEAMNFLVGY